MTIGKQQAATRAPTVCDMCKLHGWICSQYSFTALHPGNNKRSNAYLRNTNIAARLREDGNEGERANKPVGAYCLLTFTNERESLCGFYSLFAILMSLTSPWPHITHTPIVI